MSISLVPNRFVTATNLDPEAINDNLEALAADIQRNLDKRYTYSSFDLNLDGVTNASAQVLRELAIRLVSSAEPWEVFMVEFYIYAAGTEMWTLTCSDTTWPSITTTAAGATTESTPAISLIPVPITSSSADVTFTASCPNASTITAGKIVVHVRSDRGNQDGLSHAGYTPTLLNSASSTAGATLDTELNAAATAVGHDTANQLDTRIECFTIRGVASGTTITMKWPSGVHDPLFMYVYQVSATDTVTATYGSSAAVAVAGTGAAARARGSRTLTATTVPDDPMTVASDTTLTLVYSGGGTTLLTYVVIFYD